MRATTLDAIFAVDGPLAAAIPGYRQRAQQVAMAGRIEAAIRDNRILVAEAGTGTGKTFAYLVPALRSGGKVIVSTGTKTLQDQLFKRDLPAVRDALGLPLSIALLKGRGNYVCHYHLARAVEDGRFVDPAEIGHMRTIAKFAKVSRTGDKAELSAVPEDSGAWAMATSTRDNCLGQECPHHGGCFVLAARREAMVADVVVVNHHLFFADVMLKDEGMAELLPACNAVIFDEAHQIPDVAGVFFGEAVGSGQLIDLARDTRMEAIAGAKDYLPLQEAARLLEKSARDLRLALPRESARLALAQIAGMADFGQALATLERTLTDFSRHLESQATRAEGLANCLARTHELMLRLKHWRGEDDDPENPNVRWVDAGQYTATLNLTPLSVAKIFRRQIAGHPRAWIFASATLAVGADFSHYRSELGLDDADTGCWGSPFDYAGQALLYCPQGLPEPNDPDYNEAVVAAAWPAIRAAVAAGKGSFVLCTSLRAMRRIHELLKGRIDGEEHDDGQIPLLLQGESSKSELLERFRRLGNAVLVASQSFWEGVDVRGEALSLVVIDKLPFAPPDDPVLAARIEHMKKQGRNAFFEYQLPRTVISMKQGAGRLIRDETDQGVLMICDPRLIGKSYGKRIWRSLPPMRRTREESEVVAFFGG